MANPPGTAKNRWDQAARALARDTGWTETVVDTWLNDVWANMFGQNGIGDEIQGWIDGHARLKLWLEANSTNGATLPMAFYLWVT